MIGIGMDVVDARHIARSLRREPRFAEEVFSLDERSACEGRARREVHYAARFAAKEAFVKALGMGFFEGVTPREVEMLADARGTPRLRLGATAARALARAGGGAPLISLSRDAHMVLAVVIVP